jgi:rod shape-determining protein MreD
MTRCIILGALATYLVAVLQATLSARFAVLGVPPDLPFLWSVALGILGGPHAGLLAGFGSGVIEGALRQTDIGALAIGRGASGFAAGLIAARMFRENPMVPAIVAAALTLLNEFALAILSHTHNWQHAGRVLGVRIMCHAVLAPVSVIVLGRLSRLLVRRRIEAG